jgi:hypothetical protein
VAAGLVEFEGADVRGEDFGVALLRSSAAMKVWSSLRTMEPLGVQRMRPWPTVFVDVEEAEVLADDAVVALGGFFLLLEVFVEFGLGGEGGAVDADEAVGVFVAVPVGGGEGHDACGADAAGAGDVRAAAEVFPVLAGVPVA